MLFPSSDQDEEDYETITDRLKIRPKSGRSVPLRQVDDDGHDDGLTVNLRGRENIDPDAAYRQGQLAAYAARKILEGDELPHRKDDLKPEDIVEHEQEPPETVITAADKTEISADLLDSLVKREKDEDDTFYSPSPHAEDHHHRFHREINNKLKGRNIK